MLYRNIRQGLSGKHNLVPINLSVDTIVNDQNKDWYSSIYFYEDEHVEHLKKENSLAGIQNVKTNLLVFDFDSKDNLEEARQGTIETIARLIHNFNVKDTSIATYFSGCKGYSIEVLLDHYVTPSEEKDLASKIAGDLPGFDTKIYDPQRIFRIPNTKHPKSGLFKIPLELWELEEFTPEKTKELAKQTRQLNVNLEPSPLHIEIKTKEEKIQEKLLDFDYTSIDMRSRPKGIDEARWLLMNGFFRNGERSSALLCLASTLKNQGYPKEIVYRHLKGVAQLQAERTGEDRYPDKELFNNIVVQVFGKHWKGGQFSLKDPASWLYQYASRMGISPTESGDEPIQIADVEKSFRQYVENIDKNTITLGIPKLDKVLHLTTGMVFSIVGSASSGKTSVALEILKNTSGNGVLSVFASLDMHRNRLFEKLLYKVSGGLPRTELYDKFRSGEGQDLIEKVKQGYGNVWFYDKGGPNVHDLREYILGVQHKTNEKVKMVCIDYFERLNCDVHDDTGASKKIASELQDLANDLDVCVVNLVQPNKMSLGGGPDKPILNYTAIKGSGFLYQSSRAIISLWRPFFIPKFKDLDKFIEFAILKNDLGQLDQFVFGWEGKTGDISELTDKQYLQYKEFMEIKTKAEKQSNSAWD